MSSTLAILSVVLTLASVLAYPYQPQFALLKPNVDCTKNPQPLSYHIHVTYMLTNEQQIQETSALRDRAIEHFKPFLGADPACPGTKLEPSGRYGEPSPPHC